MIVEINEWSRLKSRDHFFALKLIVCRPKDKRIPEIDLNRNQNSSSKCEKEVDIRNEWMVDHSARVIAIYNRTAGGTKKTIDYAEYRDVKVDIYEA